MGAILESQLMGCSFMKKEDISLSDILDSEISLKDKYWFVCNKVVSVNECRQIAIDVAEIVLPI